MAKRRPATQPIEVVIDARQQVRLRNRDLIDFQRKVGRSLIAWGMELETKRAQAGDDEAALMGLMADVDWTAMTALLWIVGRRSTPGMTWEDALDADVDQQSMLGLYDLIGDPTTSSTPSPATSSAT